MWLQRYYLVRRLLYMGYDTLMLDADCILFHDPYPFLKVRVRIRVRVS